MATIPATVKTRVSRTVADRLTKLARRNRRSVAEELRIAIEQHLSDAAQSEDGRNDV